MAQYIPLPDGTYLKLQEGESPSQGFQRAREKYPEAFATPAKPAPEPGIGGQIKEFGKGLVPGAVGLLESAAIGASSILPEDLEKSARAGIKSLAGAAKAPFAPSAGYEESVGRKLGEAVGSTVPFLAAGPFGLAGRIGAAGLGVGAGSGEARTRAEASGATAEQRSTATALGIIPGLAEIFAPFRILSRIPDAATATGVNMVKRALIAGGEEAAQEAASNWAQNLIAKGVYKPEQELIEGLGESAAYGGATGALIQGVMDLALGRRARGAAAAQQQEEEQKKQAAALEQEEARKKTPEYLLQLNTDYEAAKVRQQELDKAAKKPGKDAPPDVWETYKQARDEANTHKNQTLIPLGKEVSKNKAAIAQLKERQRVEGLTQEQYLIETLGEKAPDTEAGVDTSFVDLAQTTAAAPAPTPEASAVEKYVADRIELANQQTFGTATANDYVDYLMQDPGMAAQVAASKIALPGLDRKTNATVLSALKLQLKEKVGARLSQEQADLAAQQQITEKDPLALWKASLEQTEEQATEELLRPNFETLRPSGPATVAVPENITPMQNPGVMLTRIDDLIATRDQAARDAETAFAAGNKELGAKKAAEREAAQSALNNISQSEGAPRAIVELRKAQDTALLNTAQLTDDLKSGRVLGGPEAGTASSTPETLINQINKQREAFIKAAVQEAATIRRLFGKSITQEEAAAAAKEMQAVFDEWVTRSMAQPRKSVEEERVVQPAQMRGTELVEGAITERVDPRPLEERQFGAYKAATQVLQEQLQKIVSKLTEVPKEGKRVEPVLKTQFAPTEASKVAEERGETAQTLEGALRRRRDYVNNLIDQALQTRNVPGIARMLLERAQDFLQQGRGTTAFLDAAENLASRLVRGQNIERSDLVDLRNELRAESARPGEAEVAGEREGQRELFGTEERRKDLGVIRETRARFENAPIVKRARAAAEKAKKLLEDLRVAFDAADAAAEKAKASKVKKAEADIEARREDLREAFQTALNKAQIAEVTAKFQPQIDALIQQLSVFGKERAKALREKETVYAKDLEVIIQAERETLQDLRQQLATALKAPAAAVEPAALPKGATRVVRGLTQPAELAAAGDEWVQFERDRLAKAEAKLRNLKGPERTTVAKEVKQQRAKVNETESIVTRARTGLGLPGLRRVAGKVEQFESAEKIAETQAQAAKERRAEAAETAAASAKIKEEQTAALENKILELGTEIENQKAAFKRAKTQESKTKIGERIEQLTKDVRIAEGQLEAQGEKKPRRKGPATARSSAALMKQKPLRTGYRKALEAASEGMRAEREGEMQLESWTLGDINFSRGATANPSTTDSVRAELKEQFPDLGRVQIYDSVDALIKANPQYEGKIPADARGFVDTAGNKAFLIAENINQGQALSVLLHEVGAHIGMRETLGNQYNASINAVENWAKKDDGSLESRIAKAAQARVEKADTPASQQRDELIAYAVEEAVNAGVKPTETKSPIGRWLGQIMSMFRNALRKFGLASKDLTAQELVDMAYGAAKLQLNAQPTVITDTKAEPKVGELFFSKKVDYAPGMEQAGKVASTLIGKPKTAWQSAKENLFGLNFRTQFVDALAPIEAVASQMKDSLKASQMMYYLRMYGQRMNFTSQAVERGAPVVREIKRKDGRIERIIEATDGANIKDIVALLSTKEVKAAAGSADAANKLFTLYLAAIRAKRVGMDALNFGGKVTEAELNAAFNQIESNPVLKDAFGKARDLYNEYNRDLLKFAVQTGAISQDLAAKLLSENDYVPFYRVRDGVAELVIGTETPIRVGNLKDSPHLQELIGGDEAIFNFLDSSVQNTAMLIDMSMRNLAVKNSMYELSELGLVNKPVKASKKGPSAGAITFKKDGEEYYVVPQKEKFEQYGVPSELLVKGLEGIPTMFPAFVRLFGVPSRFLRRVVVASPVYMARQLFRDSLASYIISGSNATPVFGALKQIGKVGPLEKRGITGGQVFTGMPEDVSRLLAEMQSGRPGWDKALTSLEALSMKSDALSRRAQYESYIAQGMSEMEATLLSLESMNFSKRGVSPTVHMATTLIPFMNAQIQSLDVLYKAFSGKMPFNDKIAIRDKMLTRGLLLAAMSLAYAAGMEDDETYKNALPDQKYNNWFVKVPGLEEAVKVPIPFEIGYIFKALPEALYNSMTQERGAAEAKEAFTNILRNLIPGGSSFFIPQAVKPLIEVGMGKSFFTGRDLETAQEQAQMPGTRYRDNTSEAAKFIGEMTNVSPVKLESLISGYTGSMGLALLQSLNMVLPTSAPDKATKRLSDMPVVGTLFQPKDAGGIINDTYKQLEEATQAQASYKALVNRGEFGKAQALLQTSLDEMSLNALATNYKSNMGKLTKAENMIRASSMSPDEKREALDRIRQAKIQIATAVRGVLEKRAPLASPA